MQTKPNRLHVYNIRCFVVRMTTKSKSVIGDILSVFCFAVVFFLSVFLSLSLVYLSLALPCFAALWASQPLCEELPSHDEFTRAASRL